MSQAFDPHVDLREFGGTAPLFPLNDVVLFPHVLLPLHIFEPRYRRMTEDILASDGFLAMARPLSGSVTMDPAADPPLHAMVCLGRVVMDRRIDDGRFQLVVQGVTRARLERELPREGLPYRRAALQVCPDDPRCVSEDEEARRELLLREFREVYPEMDVNQVFQNALGSNIPLGTVCDVLSHAIPSQPEAAQRILDATDVEERWQLLRTLLLTARIARDDDEFPPRFSVN